MSSSSSIIHLNIGGKKFCTTVDPLTLREPDSMLATMFSGRHDVNGQMSENGFIFIDRDGKHFRHILNWLRDGAVPAMEYRDYMELLREAEYFQIVGLIEEVKAKIAELLDESKVKSVGSDLTRTDIIKCLQSHRQVRLQLQGVNLSGVDLSGLDLEQANFRKANLRGANLKGSSWWGANLEQAILTEANLTSARLDNANLNVADLKGANLEGAILSDESTILTYANLEGSNLEGARLRFGYNTGGMNLTRANLKGVIINVSKGVLINAYGAGVRSMSISDLEMVASKFGIILTCANLTDWSLSVES